MTNSSPIQLKNLSVVIILSHNPKSSNSHCPIPHTRFCVFSTSKISNPNQSRKLSTKTFNCNPTVRKFCYSNFQITIIDRFYNSSPYTSVNKQFLDFVFISFLHIILFAYTVPYIHLGRSIVIPIWTIWCYYTRFWT